MKRRSVITLTGAAAWAGGEALARAETRRGRAQDDRPVTVETDASGVSFVWSGTPLLRYQTIAVPPPRPEIGPEFARGGYISAVRTPGGRLVTDDFPPNHVHHHGIWFAWVKTRFPGGRATDFRTPDFWNMGERTGTVEFVALDGTDTEAGGAGLGARHRHIELSAKPPAEVAQETWRIFVHRPVGKDPRWFLVDLDMTFVVTADRPLHIVKHIYGGLGVRGHRDWDGPAGVRFLTSEGCGRPAGNETRVRWVDMTGTVNGLPAGLAALGHPENFRAPQPARLHHDQPYFSLAPAQLGDFDLAPGQTYRSRYRFMVHDGELAARTIEEQARSFAG